MEVQAAVGIFENAVFEQIFSLVAVHQVDRVPVAHLSLLFCRTEDNRCLFCPFGNNCSLDEDAVFADTVAISVFSGEFDQSARRDQEPAPFRNAQVPLYPDASPPDAVAHQRLIGVSPGNRK